MKEFLRKKIIDNRTKTINKKIIIQKSIHKNDKLLYSIKSFGKINKNKTFYVINRFPGGGMFSNLNFVIHHLYIADKFGFIPIIDMENFPTFYNEKSKINNSYNSWDYYFEKINKYNLKEVYKSANVILINNKTYKCKYFDGYNNLGPEHKKILNKYIKFKQDIIHESKNFINKNFTNKKILGVHFRGTDQKTQERHPYPATIPQMEKKIYSLLDSKKFDKVFLVTEEKKYLNYFKNKISEKLLYTKSYVSKNKNIFEQSTRNRHRYKIGRENIINMICLSTTDHILSVSSNLADAATFFSKKKIPNTKIENGYNSDNIFIAQFMWYIKKYLPEFLGGFKI